MVQNIGARTANPLAWSRPQQSSALPPCGAARQPGPRPTRRPPFRLTRRLTAGPLRPTASSLGHASSRLSASPPHHLTPPPPHRLTTPPPHRLTTPPPHHPTASPPHRLTALQRYGGRSSSRGSGWLQGRLRGPGQVGRRLHGSFTELLTFLEASSFIPRSCDESIPSLDWVWPQLISALRPSSLI